MKEKLLRVVLPVVGGIVLSIAVSSLLYGHVPNPVQQGIAFWVLMVSQFPLMVYLYKRDEKTKGLSLSFPRHLFVATLAALCVGALSTLL